MTLSDLAEYDNAALSDIARDPLSDAQTLMFAQEEQILRGLAGVSQAILADIFVNSDSYRLSFDDAAMVSRYMVNREARRIYRESSGQISAEVALELRYSFFNTTDTSRFADDLYSRLAAGLERPLGPAGFVNMGIELGDRVLMLADFESINSSLESVGSPIRFNGTQPQEGVHFEFVLFMTPPKKSVSIVFESGSYRSPHRPKPSESWEHRMRTRVVSRQPEVASPSTSHVAADDPAPGNIRMFEVFYELARSPLLPPDVEGVNFDTGRARYINVWRGQLQSEWFQ